MSTDEARPTEQETLAAKRTEVSQATNTLNSDAAQLYALWALDVVPSLGIRCGKLFQDHPQQFKKVPAETVSTLAQLRFRTGKDPEYLDDAQRNGVANPILGDSDGNKSPNDDDAFHRASTALQKRAVDFVRRVYDTGEAQLRDAFRDAALTLQQYLTALEGAVLKDAIPRFSQNFAAVTSVLQNQEFAAGLGLPPAPSKPWPFDLSDSGDGASLVSTITRQTMDKTQALNDQVFLCVQRIAVFGSAAIDRVLRDPSIYTTDGATDDVISLSYRWWTALDERKTK